MILTRRNLRLNVRQVGYRKAIMNIIRIIWGPITWAVNLYGSSILNEIKMRNYKEKHWKLVSLYHES